MKTDLEAGNNLWIDDEAAEHVDIIRLSRRTMDFNANRPSFGAVTELRWPTSETSIEAEIDAANARRRLYFAE